jgi:hypothetical protein
MFINTCRDDVDAPGLKTLGFGVCGDAAAELAILQILQRAIIGCLQMEELEINKVLYIVCNYWMLILVGWKVIRLNYTPRPRFPVLSGHAVLFFPVLSLNVVLFSSCCYVKSYSVKLQIRSRSLGCRE